MIQTFPRLAASAFFLAAFLLIGVASPAEALETKAREALLIDLATGTTLLEKDADTPMPPASMSKIMTVFMVFERLKDGRLSLDDELPVSEKAWKMGGSKMFVRVNTKVRVEDLLRGVIVQSGNDACIVLAEGLAGTEEAFAAAMTQRAREIGMTNSNFANATGWPDPNQWMTPRDLVTLASRIIEDFPEYYGYFSETEFTWSDIRQSNRNPLLFKSVGADGLKTGHTQEAGYGLTASAVQGGRRLVLVLNGMSSQRERAEESARIIAWGFREFENYPLVKQGETVDDAPVWLGSSSTVPLVATDDFTVTLSRAARNKMKVNVVYESPIPAPIEAGQVIAKLVVTAPDTTPVEIPLQAGEAVERLGMFGRLSAALKFLIFGAS
jgi:serine-type D-Ala-D-Ala carboxypeptidase (penicillin-binding protein 5/6)